MTNEQKEQIRDALLRYTAGFATQKEAAESLDDVSATTLSLLKNDRWEKITERTWQHIARQVGFYCAEEWKQADTGPYLLLRILFGDAQRYAMAYGVAIGSGLGKTYTAKYYAKEHANAHYIACNEQMNRKGLLDALIKIAGGNTSRSAEASLAQVTALLGAQEEPLIIIDDAHKLKDRALHFAALLYKTLINKCGIIILGSDELRSRVVEGARLNKELHQELYNAIGRRFITLGQLGPRDVEVVCRANGVTNEATITEIKDTCRGSLHHATSLIHAARLQSGS
ncbi:MAG: ATP-binding protein [Taibaiella sp.]|nr:ATP-binding protein [Taibaiella sp.]